MFSQVVQNFWCFLLTLYVLWYYVSSWVFPSRKRNISSCHKLPYQCQQQTWFTPCSREKTSLKCLSIAHSKHTIYCLSELFGKPWKEARPTFAFFRNCSIFLMPISRWTPKKCVPLGYSFTALMFCGKRIEVISAEINWISSSSEA